MTHKLKPCPVCGGKAILFDAKDYGYAFVQCESCGMSLLKTSYTTDDQAITVWNDLINIKSKPITFSKIKIYLQALEENTMLKNTLIKINDKAIAFEEDGPFEDQEAFDRIREIEKLSEDIFQDAILQSTGKE